jgi:pSer/pThr/pTyr-binding forkhead associated (FHA) protein
VADDPRTTGPFSIDDDAGDAGGPALIVRSGSLTGVVHQLEEPDVTVGRSPTCDIFLDDITVSRNHARLTLADGVVTLEDLDSLNGTYVNRRRIVEPETLSHGDELQIGKFRLAFISG